MAISKCYNILTINSGSSSLKFALFCGGAEERLTQSGRIERIGVGDGLFHVTDGEGRMLVEKEQPLPDHDAAMKLMLECLKDDFSQEIDAVGHRVVHGGGLYFEPHMVTPELLAALEQMIPIAPDHLPHELKAIHAVNRFHPAVSQVVCFDTAFHRNIPAQARIFALPRSCWQDGVRRYGFHGLSYEYILEELRKEAGDSAARGRLVIAHLGNGASMAAVYNGQSIDTTMGFSPAGGLMMGTRCGDIDPGLIAYLMVVKDLSPKELSELVNEQSGLLGVSGISSDMKDLLAKESVIPEAAEAVALFCYQAKKFLGGLIAILAGLDTLVFTGGIGENSPAIRRRICEGLSFAGVHVNHHENDSNAPVISERGSPVTIRVMKTNEELMIARHTCRLLSKKAELKTSM